MRRIRRDVTRDTILGRRAAADSSRLISEDEKLAVYIQIVRLLLEVSGNLLYHLRSQPRVRSGPPDPLLVR
jgi:hypothetical protein